MKVKYSDNFSHDLENILDFTERYFGPDQATRLIDAIEDCAEKLVLFPLMNRQFLELSDESVREMKVDKYPFLILYDVHKLEVIEFLRIYHTSMSKSKELGL